MPRVLLARRAHGASLGAPMNNLRLCPFLLMFVASACITAARPAGDGGEGDTGNSAVSGGEALLLDDFESGSNKAGQPWSASADQNNLGSAATFVVEDG